MLPDEFFWNFVRTPDSLLTPPKIWPSANRVSQVHHHTLLNANLNISDANNRNTLYEREKRGRFCIIFHCSRRAAIGCWNYERIWCGTQLCSRRGKFVCRVQLLRHMLWVLSPSSIMEAIRYVRGSNGALVDTSFWNKHDSNPSHVSLLEYLRMTTVKPNLLRHHLRQPRATKTSWSETRFQHSTMKILYHQYKAAKRWKEKITIHWR